jgi:hypothetical protein
MWYDDKQAGKRRVKGDSQEIGEGAGDLRTGKASLEALYLNWTAG